MYFLENYRRFSGGIFLAFFDKNLEFIGDFFSV
jgi:hypothetical protein